jgi:predicted nuclease of predicted toxin-antitoxin system
MFRLIADENVPYSIVYRLEHYGHDVEHVDFVTSLGKGTNDEPIARYSIETDRLILTNDDDFLRKFDETEYNGVLFIENETLSETEITEIVHAISLTVRQTDVTGVFYVSSNWL